MTDPITIGALLGIGGFLIAFLGFILTLAKLGNGLSTTLGKLGTEVKGLSKAVDHQTIIFEGLTNRVNILEMKMAVVEAIEKSKGNTNVE